MGEPEKAQSGQAAKPHLLLRALHGAGAAAACCRTPLRAASGVIPFRLAQHCIFCCSALARDWVTSPVPAPALL
jgi:hypothetical protein